ncbi:3-oxoacyl-ACP synthase [Salarchaeum sp. JOR-1]|uniref:3-oxoacyl-ACP synthase n=1 Tax=Salarchaeum sp. JOR-1 TaxID=2599399 RepID=UPI0011987B74|nr:3-oxoacyl-ACP synthase [Salarchaeum sp. JOR-1]QDX39363.1 3-oxoacyl-ACP synthase [Salarchaeum sp. JOR-1]
MTVTLTGLGTYLPDNTLTGAEIAARSGIPEDVVVEKMGIVEKRVCPPDGDHATDMCVAAARDALDAADVAATDLDLVVYHGSEYKDFVVWSAAADVADRLGAANAYAKESYALCAGYPVTLHEVAAQLETGDVDTALLVGASREEDLVDYTDADASFMFNFGSGACASVLERDAGDRAVASCLGHAARTDGSFSRDVVMPAGGSRHPPSERTVSENMHALTVPDPDGMKERLGEVSLENFLHVADAALDRAGLDRDDVDFAAITHMKRSFHDYLTDELGVGDGHHYLDRYGHVQSVDQILAVRAGRERGLLEAGDVVLALAAGTGYTWAASALRWR